MPPALSLKLTPSLLRSSSSSSSSIAECSSPARCAPPRQRTVTSRYVTPGSTSSGRFFLSVCEPERSWSEPGKLTSISGLRSNRSFWPSPLRRSRCRLRSFRGRPLPVSRGHDCSAFWTSRRVTRPSAPLPSSSSMSRPALLGLPHCRRCGVVLFGTLLPAPLAQLHHLAGRTHAEILGLVGSGCAELLSRRLDRLLGELSERSDPAHRCRRSSGDCRRWHRRRPL